MDGPRRPSARRKVIVVLATVVLIWLAALHLAGEAILTRSGLTFWPSQDLSSSSSSSSPSSPSSPSSSSPSSKTDTPLLPDDSTISDKDRGLFWSLFPERPPAADERFLGYIPHSGFHNQRMSLENALLLAAYLNRTLLLPPLYSCRRQLNIVWGETSGLLYRWSLRSRDHSEICRNVDPSLTRPKTFMKIADMNKEQLEQDCWVYHAWTTTPWTYIFDLPKVIQGVVGIAGQTEPIRVFDRPNVSVAWMQEHLQIQDLDKEVYWINATTRWDLQVLDDSDPDYIAPPVIVEDPYHVEPVYETKMLLSDLKARTEKVIHFGSIYGTGRVTALSEKHLQLEHYINGHLDIRNHHVLDATDLALKQLEEWRIMTGRAPDVPSFLGAHFRTGDGGFVRKVAENLQVLTEWVREMVKQGPTILPTSTTAELPPPPTRRAATEQQNIPSFLDRCMGQPPESPLIFVATDIPAPRESPVLTAFLEEFPCTAFLSDLPASIAILDVRNPVDNVKMMSYLIALMDANVAAHGREFHGTPQSTVTYYIKDHLWPQYHPERHVLVN